MTKKNLFFNHKVKLLTIIFTILVVCSSSSNLYAQRDLILFPKRVVFEGAQRMQILNLANTGNEVAKYNISIVQIRMKENGAFENITEPDSGQSFADPYIRIFPRTVTLQPKESQVVKIQLRNSNLLSKGEYRSHIYFRGVPNETPLMSDSTKDTSNTGNSVVVRLVPIYGVTIPVIIRVGESNTEVSLSDLYLNKNNEGKPTIHFDINRIGNMSIYGEVEVEHISEEGIVNSVGIIKGVAVYTPNIKRKCELNLKENKNVDFTKGKLLLKYFDRREDKVTFYVEKELLLN